jgi:hypothetical protein
MTNPNDSVTAKSGGVMSFSTTGLTKREYFAAMAMQGMLANTNINGNLSDFANEAVRHADALIEALNK